MIEHQNNVLNFLDNDDEKDNEHLIINSADREKIIEFLHYNQIYNYKNGAQCITFPIAWLDFKIYKVESGYHFIIKKDRNKRQDIEIIKQDVEELIEEIDKAFDYVEKEIQKFEKCLENYGVQTIYI